MHITDDVGMRALHECPKPVVDLFVDGCHRELIALQSLGTSCCGIGMARRGVPHTEETPAPLG